MSSDVNKYMADNYGHTTSNPFTCKGYRPYKKINVEVSTNNLIDCSKKLEECGINYRLVFGTLLGLYRGGDLIPYDTDVDIAINIESDKIIKFISVIESAGFDIVRYTPDCIISVGRGGDYVDLYLFRPRVSDITMCDCGGFYLKQIDFECDNTIEFKGRRFPTINDPEDFFRTYYGSDWEKPVKDLHGTPDNKNKR